MCYEARREKDSLVFSLEEKEREEPLFSVGMMIHRILSESSKSGNDTRGPCVSHDRRTTMQKTGESKRDEIGASERERRYVSRERLVTNYPDNNSEYSVKSGSSNLL